MLLGYAVVQSMTGVSIGSWTVFFYSGVWKNWVMNGNFLNYVQTFRARVASNYSMSEICEDRSQDFRNGSWRVNVLLKMWKYSVFGALQRTKTVLGLVLGIKKKNSFSLHLHAGDLFCTKDVVVDVSFVDLKVFDMPDCLHNIYTLNNNGTQISPKYESNLQRLLITMQWNALTVERLGVG